MLGFTTKKEPISGEAAVEFRDTVIRIVTGNYNEQDKLRMRNTQKSLRQYEAVWQWRWTNSSKTIFERADNVSVLSKFYCGVTAIDDFVHSSEKGLQKYLDHHRDFVQSEVAHDWYPDRAITTRMYKAITYDEKLIK